jgi:hypothetical protein
MVGSPVLWLTSLYPGERFQILRAAWYVRRNVCVCVCVCVCVSVCVCVCVSVYVCV